MRKMPIALPDELGGAEAKAELAESSGIFCSGRAGIDFIICFVPKKKR